MSTADHTYAADGTVLGQDTRSRFPRLLFLPSGYGSSGTTTAVLADCLSGEGWTATDSRSMVRVGTEPGRRISWIPGPIRRVAVNLQTLIRQIQAHDLVHISCHETWQIVREAIPSLVLARFFGKKVLLHFVSAEIERLLESKRKWLLPFLRLADGIVVGSRYLQKVFGRVGLSAVAITRPLVIADVNHRTLRDIQPRILVNCPLEADLNVTTAIKAFRLVKQKYPRTELVIAGDGSRRDELERLVRHHSLYGVEFRGSLTDSETAELYQSCDLYLHSPVVDESPASLARAFAAGLPVVATDADGLLHMVRDGVNALLAVVGDHVGLADAVIELIENPELTEKLSRRGRVEARKYAWPRLRQDWVNLYRGLVV